MKVRYDGPFDEVEIPDLGVVVKRGEEFEVDSTQGAALLEQSENFTKSGKSDKTSTQEG